MCGGHFRIMWLVVPISIVITRDRIFAACSHCNIVHIHNRHVENCGVAAQIGGDWIITRQPLDESLADPTGTSLPGMLPRLNPDVVSGGIADANSLHGSSTTSFR